MSAAEAKVDPLSKKNFLILGGIIVAGIGMAFLNSGSKKVESVDISDNPIEIGTDQVNDISVKDKDAALTAFAKNFESFEQKLMVQQRETQGREEALRKELKNTTNSLKAQVSSLSDELVALRANGIENEYQGANLADGKQLQKPKLPDLSSLTPAGIDLDGLNFDMTPPMPSGPQPQASSNPYGPNYFILKPRVSESSILKKNGGDPLNASEGDLFSSMSAPAPQNSNYSTAQPQQAADTSTSRGKQYDNATDAYNAQLNDLKYNGQRMERITIPAFSFVEVTTLHGVACPIGANSPDSKDTNIPARPVVLPVRGIFRGPNGKSVDVGTIHLMGLCSGRRTSSSVAGRATIRLEQMSYWDEGGDSQMTTAVGYIVDTRDNEQDVYGRIDQASGKTLALESMAAAGAAFASALSQSEYTTQNNLNSDGSSSVQQLTGSATKAATTQGIAAIFNKIAGRFEQEATAAIDTVIVEPGIRLRFVTEQPINIFKPAEALDINDGHGDVLL